LPPRLRNNGGYAVARALLGRDLSATCMLSSERHYCTRDLRDQLVIVSKNVAGIATDLPSNINRLRDRAQAPVPEWAKEIYLQIDAGETLVLLEGGRVSSPNRQICYIAQHAAMNCSHGIPVLPGISNQLNGRGARSDINEFETQRCRDSRRINETRTIGRGLFISGDSTEEL
jgi:hypothetical protein